MSNRQNHEDSWNCAKDNGIEHVHNNFEYAWKQHNHRNRKRPSSRKKAFIRGLRKYAPGKNLNELRNQFSPQSFSINKGDSKVCVCGQKRMKYIYTIYNKKYPERTSTWGRNASEGQKKQFSSTCFSRKGRKQSTSVLLVVDKVKILQIFLEINFTSPIRKAGFTKLIF